MVGLGVTSGIDPLDRHAEVVRRSGRFAAVTVARIASGPAPRELLDRLDTPVVHVLPFLMSDGYINRIVLPRALALDGPVTMRSGAAGVPQLIRCLRPVGVASGMTGLLRRHLLEVCRAQALAPKGTDVLLVAHGLSDSNDVTEAEQHAASLMTDFAAASAAFLERPPLIAEALRRRGDGVTIVLGILVASGLHGGNDVPGAI